MSTQEGERFTFPPHDVAIGPIAVAAARSSPGRCGPLLLFLVGPAQLGSARLDTARLGMARIPLLSPHGANGVLPESCMVIGRVVLINNNNKNKHKNTLKTKQKQHVWTPMRVWTEVETWLHLLPPLLAKTTGELFITPAGYRIGLISTDV